jgi:hypothetical protein
MTTWQQAARKGSAPARMTAGARLDAPPIMHDEPREKPS